MLTVAGQRSNCNFYPSTVEITQLAQSRGAFQFLHDEPDIYTLEDGEPV